MKATPKKKVVKKVATKKVGRPTKYTKELASKICSQLAIGKSMRTVCIEDDMPAMSTVFLWLQDIPEFSEQYEKAKQESADAMAEEIQDIADNGTNDWIEIELKDKEGNVTGTKEVFNHEHVQRSRLRVDARKWLMSKMKPKKYGDKLDVVSDGEKIQNVPITGVRVIIEK